MSTDSRPAPVTDPVHIARLLAETTKLNAETMKLTAEAAKLTTERRWYPIVVGAGLMTAGAAIAKFFGG